MLQFFTIYKRKYALKDSKSMFKYELKYIENTLEESLREANVWLFISPATFNLILTIYYSRTKTSIQFN